MLLAQIQGSGLVHSLFAVLIIGLCLLIVWWVGKLCISALNAPAIVLTVWNGLFVLVGAIVIINFLLGLVGHPFITYW